MEQTTADTTRDGFHAASMDEAKGGRGDARPQPPNHHLADLDTQDPPPQWEQLPGAALKVITEELDMQDFKEARLVCKHWMLACHCRRLRLTLSCMEHEHLWKCNPAWLAHLVSRKHLHVSRLRVREVPLGQGRSRPHDTDALPSSLGKLAEMVEQVPLTLEEVQLALHPLAKEGLDNGPSLSPAWSACIARMAHYSPGHAAALQHPQQLHLHGPRALGQRRVKLDATALQQGYCGSPGSACLHVGILHQLAAQVPGMSSVALSVRTSSPAAAAELARMTALRALRLSYEETLSPGVGPAAAGTVAAVAGAAAAVVAAVAAFGQPRLGAGPHVGGIADSFPSSFLSPLTALERLKHLSVSMSFPSFGPGASHSRRGSSAWCLQLLPSFPALRQLELMLVLQDAAPLLVRRAPGAPGAHLWDFGPALPPGALQQLERATIRVRGYASKDVSCSRVLEALAHQLSTLPALRHLTLGLCTSQAALEVPSGVWTALLQQGGRAAGCGPPPPRPGFAVALELSSELSRFAAFGLPNPLLREGSREGLLALPLEELRQQQQQHAAYHIGEQGPLPTLQRLNASCPSTSSESLYRDNTSPAPMNPPPVNFPLSSLRITRSPHAGNLPTHLLGHHHLLLLPQHLSLLAALGSLTELHLEYQAAALEPWMLGRMQAVCGRGLGAGAGRRKQPQWSAGCAGTHDAAGELEELVQGRAMREGGEEEGGAEERSSSAGSSGPSSTSSSFSCFSGGSGSGADGSSLLWLTQGLPLLSSLYLRAFGMRLVGAESLNTQSMSASGLTLGAEVEQPGTPLFQGLSFLGEAVGSSYSPPATPLVAAPRGLQAGPASYQEVSRSSWGDGKAPHGGDAGADASWMRFDDEVAAAAAAAWGSTMTELHLNGLDMQGLTARGLAALEGMPLLACLVLSKSPAKSFGCRSGAPSRQASVESAMSSLCSSS